MIYHRSQALASACPPLSANPVKGEIVVIPDNLLKPWNIIPEFKSINFCPDKKFDSEIVISPCRFENFSSGILMKLKLACEQRNIKITTFGSPNFFPFYSIFSDEVVIADQLVKPLWYGDGTSSNQVYANPIFDLPNFIELDARYMKIFGHYYDLHPDWSNKSKEFIVIAAEAISHQEVAERFGDWKVHVLESSYNKFCSLRDEGYLKNDLIVGELKRSCTMEPIAKKQTDLELVGVSPMQGFQQGILNLTGINDYLTTQLLASTTLNWRYICGGGSSNLFCIVPIKVLFAADYILNDQVMRELAIKRYGGFGRIYPILHQQCAWAEDLKILFSKALPGLVKASQILSELPQPLIRNYSE